MKKVEFNGNELEMYDSIQDLPIGRYQKYNLNVLIDAGIGGDLNGFRERIETIKKLVNSDVVKATKEVDNLLNNVMFVMSELSPEMNAFVVLIHKINNRVITEKDLTESGIKEIVEQLGKRRITIGIVQRFLNYFKKKIDIEFETFFPSISNTTKSKELYLMLKKKIGLKMREISMGKDFSDELKKIEKFFVSKMNPKIYGGAKGLEITMLNGFDDMCTVLEKNGVTSEPKKLTVVEFYNKLMFLERMIKERNKK